MPWPMLLRLILPWLLSITKATEVSTLFQTKPGCQDNCGNISIPYPFGIGDDPSCFMDYDFKLICNTSSDNPVLQTQDGQPVLNISLQGQLTTSIQVAVQCQVGDSKPWNSPYSALQLQKAYRVSNIRNIFMSVGCEMNGNLYDYMGKVRYISCDSLCLEDTQITGLPCAGLGCCQSSIPKDLSSFWVYIENYYSVSYSGNASKCAYSVLSEQEWLSSHVFDLWTMRNNLDYLQKIRLRNPLILDWAIRNKTSCVEAQRVAADYACGNNTYCTNSTNGPGYLCHCMEGYDGNPYLPSGCQVLDWSTVNKTCEKGSTNYACGENTYCSYSNDSRGFLCHCIEGYQGDPYLPEGCQAESTSLETKPGCQNKCGNVSIPYPFGLDGDDPTCFRDEFKLFCNTATDPPQLLMSTEFPVMDISLQGQLITLSTWASIYCYTGDNQSYVYNTSIELPNVYRFSYTRNQFTAVGCNTLGVLSDYNSTKFNLGCISSCPYDTVLTGRPCDGIGCCQTAIPKDLPAFTLSVGEYAKTTNKSNSWKISRCGLAFLSDQMWFTSNASSLWNSRNDVDRIVNIGITTPVVLDWAIREKNCKEAQRANDYACGKNANCTDSTNGPGYLCHCLNGYHGNPYLPTGCQDINECEDPKNNPCVSSCTNTIGSYYCSCPKNSYGDGRKDGQRCIAKSKAFPVIKVILGIGFGAIFLLIGGSWLNFIIRKRKLLRLKEKFFQQNGGMLLQQRISSHEGGFEFLKIFTAEELEMATNRYNEDCILGRGGQGTVYKGVLPDHRVVATKKSKVVDDGKIEQFINEIIILSQVNHRNVVKLLGCCLETEIPLLVYEYVSNGTLFDHIQRKNGISLLSWEDRLRIAIETAGAFAYLHSAASIPIIHRDIKSTNILLDDNYAAKVSDFGISRLLPTDRDQVTTLVQGTLGYLDPEYFHSGLLTEKSDVYSFGVVLVELLTGEKPVCFERSQEQRNLATYFVSSMKENHLLQIIEDELLDDRVAEKIFAVADLTNRCLNISGEHRPTMKEVAMELEGLKRLEIKSCVQELKGENVSLQSGITTPIFVPLRHYPSDASMQYSLEKDALLSMAFPR